MGEEGSKMQRVHPPITCMNVKTKGLQNLHFVSD